VSTEERRYRLYVEMQRRGRGTGVYRLVSADNETLTQAKALTVRAKHSQPSSVLLVEADSAAERSLIKYEGWHDNLDEKMARRRDKV